MNRSGAAHCAAMRRRAAGASERCFATGFHSPRRRAALHLLAIFGLTLKIASPVSAESLSPQRQQEILSAALHSFDQAAEKSREDPAAARELYRQSAAGFAALADGGVRSAALEYNLGNTCFRLGDLGRAVLHFRRGLALDPAHANLRANLQFVRSQVMPVIAPAADTTIARSLLTWHYDTSLSARFWAAAVLSAAGWIIFLVLLRVRRRPGPAIALASLLAIGGAAAGASVAWQLHDDANRPHAVIVIADQTLRLGRGESYQPALKQRLGAGVELRILSERGDWVEVRLGNDQTGWLPAAAVARV